MVAPGKYLDAIGAVVGWTASRHGPDRGVGRLVEPSPSSWPDRARSSSGVRIGPRKATCTSFDINFQKENLLPNLGFDRAPKIFS